MVLLALSPLLTCDLWAAGPVLATMGAVVGIAANTGTAVRNAHDLIHRPKAKSREIGVSLKQLVTFRKNDGKLKTLPVPKAVTP